jgi:hypothetical protein
MAAIVFRDNSLRSPSAFGHGDWEVDIWMMMSSFSAQKSALGLCCLSVCYCLILSVAYFLFVLPPYSSIRQCVLWMGVSALRSWHGLGESFSWENGSLEGIYLS